MAGTISIKLTWENIDEAIGRLDQIEKNAKSEIINITRTFASALEKHWIAVTHKRTYRLSEGNKAMPDEMIINLMNGVYYYDWVNDGHNTPKEWHRKSGIIKAKRITHVPGQKMTEKVIQYAADNLVEAYEHFLDHA
jgi:hypothetical protein